MKVQEVVQQDFFGDLGSCLILYTLFLDIFF